MLERELAAYAVGGSSGRRYETEPDPYRSDFRRDLGRVLYSRAFRRLAFKTQVFSPSEGDHYRNRLTHTLETAQIARSVAEELFLNEELAEVIAMAHDLGHPPFGHQGEYVLNELMADYGGFDHNLQNVRIVTLTEVKSASFPGLNLTYDTLFGIAKSKAAKDFLTALYKLPADRLTPSCEARVADLADDLAYTATDFDDYASYHGLSTEAIMELDLSLVTRNLPEGVKDGRIALSMCVRNIVFTLVTDLIETSGKRIQEIGGKDAPMEKALECIGLSGEIGAEYNELASFLGMDMYQDSSLKAAPLEGAEVLEIIFNAESKRRKLERSDREGHMDLCDFIAGMTDRYAIRHAARLDKR